LGSACIKAARKMLMKSTPEVYYDEVEESDYLEEDEEIFNKAGR